MEKKYNKKTLISRALLIFLLTLLTRLILLYFTSLAHGGDLTVLINTDESRYIKEAGGILSAGTLLWDVPLYPVFLAIFFKIFGTSYLLASILNIFLFSLAVVILYLTIAYFFNRERALITAATMILFPTLLIDTLYPAAEALYLLLLSFAFYAFLSYIKYEKMAYLTLTAIILGLLTLTKETFLFFPVIVTAIISFKCFPSFKLRLKTILIFNFIYILILTPFLIHNYHIYGKVGLSQKMVGVIKTLPENFNSLNRNELINPSPGPVLTVKNFFWERKRFFFGTGTFGLMRALGYETTKLELVADSPRDYFRVLKEYGPGWVIFQYSALFFITCFFLSCFFAILVLLAKKRVKEVISFILIICYFLAAYAYRYNSRYFIVLIPFLALLSSYFYSFVYFYLRGKLSVKGK